MEYFQEIGQQEIFHNILVYYSVLFVSSNIHSVFSNV